MSTVTTSEPQVQRPEICSVIYFLHDPLHQAIKIGFTKNLRKRMRSIQQVMPLTKLALIGSIEGDEDVESQLHVLFAGLHLAGEWFRDDPTLRDFIKRHGQVGKWIVSDQDLGDYPQPPDDSFISLPEMCRRLNYDTPTELLEALQRNGLPHCHFGGALYFPVQGYNDWLNRLRAGWDSNMPKNSYTSERI
jgi:hypothetical protein